MQDDPPPAGLRVAVIGAGVAGLGAGRRLLDEGHSVVLLDKGRRPGGRLSTRRHGSRFEPFDVVLVTVPAPQAEPLLAERPRLTEATRQARLRPCWAVLAEYERPLDLPFDGAFVEHPVLGWAARNSSKPGRPKGEAWVLHAGPSWSEAHLEREGVEVTTLLLRALEEAVGRELPGPVSAESHRWRYALPDPPLDQPCLYDPEAGLGAGGDWCGGPRVEGALLSGWALADRVLAARPEVR